MIFFITPDSYRDSQIKMIYAVSVFSPRITQIKRIKIGVILCNSWQKFLRNK